MQKNTLLCVFSNKIDDSLDFPSQPDICADEPTFPNKGKHANGTRCLLPAYAFIRPCCLALLRYLLNPGDYFAIFPYFCPLDIYYSMTWIRI